MPTALFRIGRGDFAIDFSDIARHGRVVPLFKPVRGVPADYPDQVCGNRFSGFHDIRRQFDSENRMINSFLSQFFCNRIQGSADENRAESL